MYKNRVLTVLFILLLLHIIAVQGVAQQGNLGLKLNEAVLDTDVPPVVVDGRVYLPARDIIESLGGRITWFA